MKSGRFEMIAKSKEITVRNNQDISNSNWTEWSQGQSLGGVQFIMVIELSGEQFGLKSYALFQNRTSVQREFDLKSQV